LTPEKSYMDFLDEKNILEEKFNPRDSQKNLILMLKKQFSSTFLLSIAFLEKRI